MEKYLHNKYTVHRLYAGHPMVSLSTVFQLQMVVEGCLAGKGEWTV